MRNINILCVGRLKEDYLRAACAEYEKRLSAFCRIRVVEVDEYRLPALPSPARIAQGLEAEGKALLSRCGGGLLVALCIEGQALSSPAFAKRLQAAAVDGVSQADFLIGGSFGLSDEVKARANLRLSMSPMTFPHQLARVLLLEQLYRACQINAGGKYHK